MMHVLANIGEKPSSCYLTDVVIPWFTDLTLLFMVVSGFSMCCGYYERIKNGTITPNAFYKKRYARILPFFALLCMIDFAVNRTWTSLYDLLANLTLCFNLLPNEDITMIGVGWFLGVVFVFYLLFPFFVFLIDNKRRALLSFAAALTLAGIATVYSFNADIATPSIGRKNIIFVMPLFLAGGMAYLWREPLSRMVRRYSWAAVAVVLCSIVAFFTFPGLRSSRFGQLTAELLLFSVMLVYGLGATDAVLNNRAVRFLSGISMEIYLCHMLVYRVVERVHIEQMIGNRNLLYALTTALVLAGAIAFAYVVKRHILPFALKPISK